MVLVGFMKLTVFVKTSLSKEQLSVLKGIHINNDVFETLTLLTFLSTDQRN